MPQAPSILCWSVVFAGVLFCTACATDLRPERADNATADAATDTTNDADTTNDTGPGDDVGLTSCAQWAWDLDVGSEIDVVLESTTLGAGNHNTPSCGGQRGEDLVIAWTAPDSGPYVFETHGSEWDTVLSVMDDCGQELACADDDLDMALLTSTLQLDVEAGSTYGIVIDGYEQVGAGSGGPVVLRITPLNRDNETGYCADGHDNDSDGARDCADADCLNDSVCRPLTNVAQICAGGSTTCARHDDGRVTCWGDANNGRITGAGTAFRPIEIGGLPAPAAELSCNGKHACAVLNNGEVWCWGSGSSGQLGGGNYVTSEVPVHANPLGPATSVSAGDSHTCAVVTTSEAQCWGFGTHGRFGLNAGTRRSEPGPSGFSNVQRFAAGESHTCALDVAGDVYCAGYNYHGQVGTLDLDQQSIVEPIRVDVHGITRISASGTHTCAASSAGAWCWGFNNGAQLGAGHATVVSGPVAVLDLDDVSDISAAPYFTCAVSGGNVLCWGLNNQFQLGHEDVDGSVPREVAGLPASTQVVTGQFHSCALSQEGHVWCWGSGRDGRLGVGQPDSSSTPVRVLSVSGSR